MIQSLRYLQMFLHSPSAGRALIGYLSQYGDICRVSFTDEYINNPRRPTLSLAYVGSTEEETRAILTASRDIRLSRSDGRWPVYFQNLLPEGHNRERLAAQRGCSVDNEFELLAAAGHDLMGGIEVEALNGDAFIPDTVRIWHTAMGLDGIACVSSQAPIEDAYALPGVITKFSAVLDGRRYVVKRNGVAGSTILKLPTTQHPELVANEFVGYRLCEACGLDCASASVITRSDADLPEHIPFGDILAVRRFDRGGDGQRVHMEEFAQVLQYEPRHKYGIDLQNDYAGMLRVLDQMSIQPSRDVQEFVNRFVVFILMGNTDAHLKNWALLYPDGIRPQLAPLYDPVCVTAFFEAGAAQSYALNRAIDRTVSAFTWEDLDALLQKARVLRRSRILQIAKGVVGIAKTRWPVLLREAPGNMRRSVMERLSGGVSLAR